MFAILISFFSVAEHTGNCAAIAVINFDVATNKIRCDGKKTSST